MQQKKLAKVNPFPDYIRVSDPNMELLSAYTILAKGEDRSLNDFAKDCGVSTSTLSRLINKKIISRIQIHLFQRLSKILIQIVKLQRI